MRVRPRLGADIAACGELVRAVHEADGYPVRLPPDPAGFLEVPDALDAWVAEDDAGLVGHVLLRRRSAGPVMQAALAATGLPADRLAVVARLLVAPRARRRGAGRALLATATARAHALGRRPVLDVVSEQRAAVALYGAEGWARVAAVTTRYGDLVFDEVVFVGPAPEGRPSRRAGGTLPR